MHHYEWVALCDRDGHEKKKAETKRRSPPETKTLASPAETRPRRDVCSSRDAIETLKYKFY